MCSVQHVAAEGLPWLGCSSKPRQGPRLPGKTRGKGGGGGQTGPGLSAIGTGICSIYPFSPPGGGKLGSEKIEGSGAGLETKQPRAVRGPGAGGGKGAGWLSWGQSQGAGRKGALAER